MEILDQIIKKEKNSSSNESTAISNQKYLNYLNIKNIIIVMNQKVNLIKSQYLQNSIRVIKTILNSKI